MNLFEGLKKNWWTETTTVNAKNAGIRTIEKDGEKINIRGISSLEQNYLDAWYKSPTTVDIINTWWNKTEIKFTNTNY